MVHPDRVVAEADLAKLPLVEPVYPLTEGLVSTGAQGRSTQALDRVPGRCPNGRSRAGCARTLSGLRRGAARMRTARRSPPTCSPDSAGLVAAGLRRIAGRPAGAGAGARASARAAPAAPPPATGTSASKTHRRPALFAHRPRRRAPSPRSSPIWPSPSACCGCCRATSAPARPWWRCSPPRAVTRPAARPR